VAEGARLESVYTGNRIEGSNPSPSASFLICILSAAASLLPCSPSPRWFPLLSLIPGDLAVALVQEFSHKDPCALAGAVPIGLF
jgi:hypothetical protein